MFHPTCMNRLLLVRHDGHGLVKCKLKWELGRQLGMMAGCCCPVYFSQRTMSDCLHVALTQEYDSFTKSNVLL